MPERKTIQGYLAAVEEYAKRLSRSCRLTVTELPEERSKLPFSTRLYELKPIERARVICLTSIEEPLAVDALPVSIRLTV